MLVVRDIPFIQVNGTGVKLIQNISPSTIRPIGVSYISDARVWMIEPPKQSLQLFLLLQL